MTICAVLTVLLTSGMVSFMTRRNKDKSIETLCDVLSGWKEMAMAHAPHDKQTPAISQLRSDAFKYLLKAIVQLALCIPLFAVSDGFVRVCQEPPESMLADVPYLTRLLSDPFSIPIKTLFYYLWIGVTISMHTHIVSPLYFLIMAFQLNIVVWLPFPTSVRHTMYYDIIALDKQPPFFDQIWLARSAYDLWSRRWHQFFRHGFRHIAYDPAKRLFGRHPWAGRLAGTLAVFVCSGLMHDYIVLSMLGYSSIQPGIVGQQTIFFLLQGIATAVSMQSPTLPTWLARGLTWIWIIYTAPMFGEPYIRLGLHHYAQVPGFPYFLDQFMQSFCPFHY
ncbi:membrane bound O-acyl transferase family-domain-containing protein [Blakeslea trispora]|nr:membrane bound O-acyl transferase family-domain-containing protein [Blakeslea trispora]